MGFNARKTNNKQKNKAEKVKLLGEYLMIYVFNDQVTQPSCVFG